MLPTSLSEIPGDKRCILIKTIHEIEVKRYSINDGKYYKEKCYDKTSIHVLMASNDTAELCKLCHFKMKPLITKSDEINISDIPLVNTKGLDELAQYHDIIKDDMDYEFLEEVPDDLTFLCNGNDFRYQCRTDFIGGFPYFDDEQKNMYLKIDNKILFKGMFYDKYHPDQRNKVNELFLQSTKRAIRNYVKNLIFKEELTGEAEDFVSKYHVVSDGVKYNIRQKTEKRQVIRHTAKNTQRIDRWI